MGEVRQAKRKWVRFFPIAKGRNCPFCPESDWARRDRYRVCDLLFLLVFLRPYRCFQCWGRFYVFR